MPASSRSHNNPLSFHQLFNLVKQLSAAQKEKLMLLLQQENSNSTSTGFFIPEKHKNIIRQRRNSAKKEDYLEWDQVKDSFLSGHGLSNTD